MKICIRTPKPKEFEAINNLICSAFNIKPRPLNFDFFNHPWIFTFIAVEDEKVIGTATLHLIQKSNRKMGLIEDVVVDSTYQNKGIGKKLINEIIAKAAQLDCYKTILNSAVENKIFYEKLGFNHEQLQLTYRY